MPVVSPQITLLTKLYQYTTLGMVSSRGYSLERVIIDVREVQRHAMLQDRHIQHLIRKLQDETQARKKGVLDLLVLQKQLQVLQRERESVKRRKRES